MSQRLDEIFKEINENISELKEEDNEQLKDMIEEVLKIFEKKKSAYFPKIIEIISSFVRNLKIPAILILNESDLLDSLLELLNNTDKGKSLRKSEENNLYSIWNIFSNIFSQVISDFDDIPKLKKFIKFELFMKSNFPNLLQKKEKIPLSRYDQLFVNYLEKNLKAEKIIKKIKNKYNKGNDEESLLEVLNELNSFEQDELFSENFSKIERFYLALEAQNTDLFKKTILKIDQNLENQIYSKKEYSLHEREYYVIGETFENKNNIETHFLDSPNIFYDNKMLYPMQKLFCGFLNAKGGRIYIGIANDKVQGCALNKNHQDSLRRQIDETVRGFVPAVQAEECRTYFYPIFKRNNEFLDLFIVKITINPNPSDVYFTPKPMSEAFVRFDSGKEVNYAADQWQTLYLERIQKNEKNKKGNVGFVDPIPFDVNDFKKGGKKPTFKSLPFEPNEWQNNISYPKIFERSVAKNEWESNEKISRAFESSEKKKREDQNIIPKILEKEIKKMIDVKKPEKSSPNICYNVLFFKFDQKISEDNFMDSTTKVYEVIKDYVAETKTLLRRKDKRYFFIELIKDVEEEEIKIVKEILASKKVQCLEVDYANKKLLKKNQDYILIK